MVLGSTESDEDPNLIAVSPARGGTMLPFLSCNLAVPVHLEGARMQAAGY